MIVRPEDNRYPPYQLHEIIRLPRRDRDYLKPVGDRGPCPEPGGSEPAFVNGRPNRKHRRYPNQGMRSWCELGILGPFPNLDLGRYPQQRLIMRSQLAPQLRQPHWQPQGSLPRKETDSYDILPARPSIMNAAKGDNERGLLSKPETQQPIHLTLHELNIPLAHVTMLALMLGRV